ncbi:5'-methylthioadenosine/S-adenosylhomocysteine nucleosidase [Sphingomonas morindae]|uniref:5'-methylthioadenosine/S-adenosylhomocysteine nucleosidase n=1 Tax=Sphingomonas morindae TaxID=1541170 RepID=A0ABY4X9K4_9SPHN|nr:5'-methylthioadenosine/S-adenosylhomocysteine nucleosidase [Sphingomonas morindae]USI73401.1 5'-methylthioadenosine/S-adenosylhomocysteine nucleosidase [Sphingomonas morindae]
MTPALPVLHAMRGHSLLFVMATEQEYGAALRARITPLITGVGPVEAGIGLAAALAGLAAAGTLPDLIVSLGSAGSVRLAHRAIYQVASVAYRDMDATALGFAPGETPFLPLAPVQPLPLRLPGLPAASLSTGADIVTGAAYDAIAADMVDMESFAYLRAAQRHGVPMIGLRGISDGAEGLATLDQWTEHLAELDAKLAAVIDGLADWIAAGGLRG